MIASSALAALLDGSFARIAELAADGRYFDRNEVVRIADVWDNNTLPLFRALGSRPALMREWRSRKALRWMAAPGPERRRWMIEQAAAAGHRLETILGPAVPGHPYHRDHRGVIYPGRLPLTAELVSSIAGDYDLERAELRTLRAERAGPKLVAFVAFVPPRRYAAPGDAEIHLLLEDIRSMWFDGGDSAGVSVTVGADGVEVRIGGRGRILAGGAQAGFDDQSWHLSRAGRAADACTPRRETRPSKPGGLDRPDLGESALTAAMLLREAMLEIRSVRYAKLVGKIPLLRLCDTFAGAGESLLGASGPALRRLAGTWAEASPHLAARIESFTAARHRPREVPRRTPALPADRAQLTLAAYTGAHTRYGTRRDASALINLAIPDGDGGWGLQAGEFPRPTGLTLDTSAFISAHSVTRAAGEPFRLGDGALTIRG